MATTINNFIETKIVPAATSTATPAPSTINDKVKEKAISAFGTGILDNTSKVESLKNITSPVSDDCEKISIAGMLSSIELPKFSGDPFDIQAFSKLKNMISNIDLPDFSVGKLIDIDLKGLGRQLDCLIPVELTPDFKDINYKSAFDKLNDIRCNDLTGGLDETRFDLGVTASILDIVNCSKDNDLVTVESINDLIDISASVDADKGLLGVIADSVVKNKFDIGSALKTTNDAVDGIFKESIIKSVKSPGAIFNYSNNDKSSNNKDSLLDYSTSLSSGNELLINNTTNKPSSTVSLANMASLDSTSKLTALPTDLSLSTGQEIRILSLARGLA